MKTMTEDEYHQWLDRLAQDRHARDEAVEAAQKRLTDAIIEAYKAGLTLYDINYATGLSITTIRSKFKDRGVQTRR